MVDCLIQAGICWQARTEHVIYAWALTEPKAQEVAFASFDNVAGTQPSAAVVNKSAVSHGGVHPFSSLSNLIGRAADYHWHYMLSEAPT